MSQVNWQAFDKAGPQVHVEVNSKLQAAMETGHHAVARELLEEYAVEYPDKAEVLRLSLVRKYGTGL